MHVHSHVADTAPHPVSTHEHKHESLGLRRALLVGMIHGAAGSAGLLILAAAAKSIPEALAYVAALSFVVSYPLRWMERCANWVSTTAFVGIGCAAIAIGANLLGHSWNLL